MLKCRIIAAQSTTSAHHKELLLSRNGSFTSRRVVDPPGADHTPLEPLSTDRSRSILGAVTARIELGRDHDPAVANASCGSYVGEAAVIDLHQIHVPLGSHDRDPGVAQDRKVFRFWLDYWRATGALISREMRTAGLWFLPMPHCPRGSEIGDTAAGSSQGVSGSLAVNGRSETKAHLLTIGEKKTCAEIDFDTVSFALEYSMIKGHVPFCCPVCPGLLPA